MWWELERRLVLIFLGKTHSSSAVHEQVIAGLEREGDTSPRLEALRHTAERSRDAIYAGDFVAFGRAMIDNTAAQAELHPALVNAEARELNCASTGVWCYRMEGQWGRQGWRLAHAAMWFICERSA